eukprot:1522239-Amphidinium_carterae.1
MHCYDTKRTGWHLPPVDPPPRRRKHGKSSMFICYLGAHFAADSSKHQRCVCSSEGRGAPFLQPFGSSEARTLERTRMV